ncbi:MAG: hypothetical protein JW882_03455 [Deltaproteobacteria bacterium]|nr:hypothetical protein [Deltaproteobacteria bacterium]
MKRDELLLKNHELFVMMDEIAKMQEKVTRGDDINAFLELIEKRRRLQRDISSNIRDYNKEKTSNASDGDDEKGLKRLTEAISEVIDSIRESDQRIEEIILKKKDILVSEIKEFRKGQKALKGYEGNRGKNPRFMDRLG